VKSLALVGLLVAVGCDEQPLAQIIDAGAAPPDLVCTTVEPNPPTWSYLYATYFGEGTPGHCGASGCHELANVGGGGKWVCGTSSDSCFQGMVQKKLINLTNPPASDIASPGRSPLVWFNVDTGNMPKDNQVPNSCAARDIPAWLASDGGATEN
jgi:hypothetical protein